MEGIHCLTMEFILPKRKNDASSPAELGED